MYSAAVFPEWARRIAFMNPLVQVMQDIRSIVLTGEQVTTESVYGPLGYLVPLSIVALTLTLGVLLLWRSAPRFAERI
jgi:ABC-type polysaccharide/polyol phosphate export permease